MKYFVVILMAISLVACSSGSAVPRKEEKKKIHAIARVEQGGLRSQVEIPAQLAAYEEVSIFPKVNAYVKTVKVDIGSKVSAGTVLMELEAPELEQAVAQAREKYARSKAEYAIDREHYLRLLEASATAGAVSALDLSTIKTKMEADSLVSNAEKANWQMQEVLKGYLLVKAPFAGVITERNVHPGALVSATDKTKPLLELKRINLLRLQCDIAEDLASNLHQGDTASFYLPAFPGKKFVGTISRRAQNINPGFRTERIEMDIDNPQQLLSPGMFATVRLFPHAAAESLYVPATAVVTSTEKKYLVTVHNNYLRQVDVITGAGSNGKLQVWGSIQAGDSILAAPDDEIREGPLQ